jgi:hypothetical protein
LKNAPTIIEKCTNDQIINLRFANHNKQIEASISSVFMITKQMAVKDVGMSPKREEGVEQRMEQE